MTRVRKVRFSFIMWAILKPDSTFLKLSDETGDSRDVEPLLYTEKPPEYNDEVPVKVSVTIETV